MIESGVGRTERAELGQRRGEPRAPAEADDREVREPWPALPLVHAEPLEPLVEIPREGGRAPVLVVEDEHPDAAGLSVAGDGEAGAPRRRGGLAQRAEEPDRRIALHATGRGHTCLCRSCVRRRRTRWSAEAAARRRIVSRSARRLNPAASSPSGPAA